jgi:hypothetical protein
MKQESKLGGRLLVNFNVPLVKDDIKRTGF